MESTQIVHRGLVKEALHAGVSKVPTVRCPITFSREPVIPANDKVVGSLGHLIAAASRVDIDDVRLRSRGLSTTILEAMKTLQGTIE